MKDYALKINGHNYDLRPVEKRRPGRGFRQTLLEGVERLRVRGNGRAQENRHEEKQSAHYFNCFLTSSIVRPKVFKKSDNGIRSREIFTGAGPPRPSTAYDTSTCDRSPDFTFRAST